MLHTLLGFWFHSNLNKLEFFSYSSPVLYKNSNYLGLRNNVARPLKERKIIFNLKKMGKTLVLILLAVVIKSICQYYLGAQDTSLEKLFSGLDYPFYQGCILGGFIMIFFQDNWNNMLDYLHKIFTIKLDSEDEDSVDDTLKNSRKGKDKLTDSNISNKTMDKGNNPEQVTTKKDSLSSGDEIKNQREALIDFLAKHSIAAHEIDEDTKSYIATMLSLGKDVKMFSTLEIDKRNLNDSNDAENLFVPLLKHHGIMYSSHQTSRLAWIKSRTINLQPENKFKVNEAITNMQIAREKYLSAISNIGRHENTATQAKVYYAALNEQRNSVNKELNKADDIILKDLKASPFCTIDDKYCKDLVRTLKDYSNAKKEFNIQDSNLKKKIGEVINKRN